MMDDNDDNQTGENRTGDSHTGDSRTDDSHDESGTGTGPWRTRVLIAIAIAFGVVVVVTGYFVVAGHTDAQARNGATAQSLGTSSTAAVAEPAPSAPVTKTSAPSPTPSPSATAPNPADSRPATPEPDASAAPSPTIASIPAGTTVAEGDVASPKGSIHFHYRMVADGHNGYSIQYSGFTSTLPVPVSATLLDTVPSVGDGLTYHGVGDHQLGGATTAPRSVTAPIDASGRPSYLTTMVTYSSATTAAGIPTEIGPGKVLVVDTVRWSIPARQTNVHPVDSGAHAFSAGVVTSKTASGAPRGYRVAAGDTTAEVAARFGISIQDLIWLNTGLQVFGDQQYLYSDTTINLDPDAL